MRVLFAIYLAIHSTQGFGTDIERVVTPPPLPICTDDSDTNDISGMVIEFLEDGAETYSNILQQGVTALREKNFQRAAGYFNLLDQESPRIKFFQGTLAYHQPKKEDKIKGLHLILAAADMGDKRAKIFSQSYNLREELARLISVPN